MARTVEGLVMRKLSSVEIHPAANLFPGMDEDSFQALKGDIAKHGQRELVTLYRGKLIDGRNRVAACEELGIDWEAGELVEDDGPIDPYEYVLSINLHRRHLTTSQRSMIAGRMATLKHGQVGNGREVESSNGDSTIHQAASLLNVGKKSVERSKQVLDKGSKAVIDSVDAGTIPVSLAAKLVNEVDDKAEQTRLAKSGPKAIREFITPQNDYEDETQTLTATTPDALADEATSWIEQLARQIDAIADANGGRGEHHKRAMDAMNAVVCSLAMMRGGER